VGRRTDAELPAYYDACDVFVMPSLLEGFGIVFIEAMAFGRPVIGGRHAGTLDLIDDGRTGFLVEHGDIRRLTVVLKNLLRDERRRAQIGEAGRLWVSHRYSFERFAKVLRELRYLPATPANAIREEPHAG